LVQDAGGLGTAGGRPQVVAEVRGEVAADAADEREHCAAQRERYQLLPGRRGGRLAGHEAGRVLTNAAAARSIMVGPGSPGTLAGDAIHIGADDATPRRAQRAAPR